MRPLAIIVGIVLGSCVAITLGLAVVLLIYVVLGTDEPALRRELSPLGIALALFSVLTAVSALSFYGLLTDKRWRYLPCTALLVCLSLTGFYYWP